ncbi:MAG: autotransporter adhesin family protein [Clostridiales bacterium]|nr:autotransporter adhesin family protein [Clostridiales bacterium]
MKRIHLFKNITLLLLPIMLAFGIISLAGVRGVKANAEDGVAHTFVIGTNDTSTEDITYDFNPVTGWASAVALSLQLHQAGEENLIKVQLASDWIANDMEGLTTSFGINENAYFANMIYVPQYANILLDLNGYIINRDLTEAKASGGVFVVAGSLTMEDRQPNRKQLSLSYEKEGEIVNVFGGTVTGGNTTENGGAVLVLDGGTFVQNGGTLFGNEAVCGGGVFVSGLGEFVLEGGKLLLNAATNYGGGVYVSSSGRLTMNDGNISGNTANYGGGIAVSGNTRFNGGTIQNNSAVSGGGVYAELRMEMTGGCVRDNRATETGGGIAGFQFLKISGGSILNNAAKRGGGISYEGDGIFDLQGECVISGNTATDGAGVLVSGDGSLDISEGASISNNTAANRGGGIFLERGDFYIEDSSVTDNSAATGGGIEAAAESNYSFMVSGNVVIENNGEQNLHLCNDMMINMHSLGDDASIYISVEENRVFTDGYTIGNHVDGATYGKKPSSFFFSDNPTQKIILNDSGELICVPVVGHSVSWSVTYEDGSAEGLLDEYGISFVYGEKAVTGVWLNGENFLDEEQAKDARDYRTRGCMIGSVSVCFTISILRRPLTDAEVALQFVGDETPSLTFTGKAQRPAVELLFRGKQMEEGVDYTLDYENNLNAGTAYAIARGENGNNFSGELRLSFTITPATDISYGVDWEFKNGEEWSPLTAQSLSFNANDRRGDVRAVLSATDNGGDQITEYVYAEHFGEAEHKNASLLLTFDEDAVIDAKSYTVHITGTPNGLLADSDKNATVVINKATISLTAADFPYEDINHNRLWVISGGSQLSELSDSGTVYFDPDASPDSYGNTVTVGTENDAYARFRGEGEFLELVLNGDYEVDGASLSSRYGFIQISYTGNRAEGAQGAVVPVHTQVTITFGENYVLGGGGNSITLSKTWYIVVINNGLSGDTPRDLVYGNAAADGFRPEHGNAIIYTVTSAGQTFFRFAAVFGSGNTRYYEAKEGDDGLEVDYARRIPSDSYFNTCLNRLPAGGYTLTAYVPQQEEEGVVYYAFTQAFPFRVNPRSIVSESGELTEGLSYFLLYHEVVYNGKKNNTPKATVVFDRTTLREGVDYELISDSVNVGAAQLTLRGKGNYAGSVFVGEVYEIVRATNSWVYTPSVTGWEWHGFKKETNRFQAAPALLDEGEYVRFGLYYDEACTSPVAGLSEFYAEGGEVNTAIEGRLRALPIGTYYVKATVRETANYTGLSPAANALRVERAANEWLTVPDIIGWNYLAYDKSTNLILASILHGSISFRLTNADGEAVIENFALEENGLVSDEIAKILYALPAGTYHLTASVSETESYAVPAAHTATFRVGQAVNGWVHTPAISAWVQGKYSETDNAILAEARFGTVRYVITAADDETNILFDSANGINLLQDAQAGVYVLSAFVTDGSSDYTDLSPYMVTFRIFPPAGFPWWGTLLIVAAALLIVAIVLIILHKKGVLQIISGKMIVAMRARAAADATIAAVRAQKKEVEARMARDRAEELDRLYGNNDDKQV